MHLCQQPMNLTRRACCQLVLLLNDTTRVPPCHPTFLMEESNYTRHTYSPPVYLAEPPEIREDHLTFLLGIFVLMLIALACTLTLSKLTKPKVAVGYGNVSNYDFMMWMPSSQIHRRSSILVFLRGMACRRTSTNRNSTVSVVSSNIGLLPSYQTATTTTPTSGIAPPPYSERQRLASEAPDPDV